MRKILLALIIIPALFAVGWTVIGTNIWGIPFGPSTYVAPTDGYAIQYQSSTKTYELKAGGGGGGGVTTFTPGVGISGAIVGTTLGVTNTGVIAVVAGAGMSSTTVNGTATVANTGVISVTGGTNVTIGGTASTPVINASVSGSGVNGTINGTGSTALTTVNITGTLLGTKASISGSTLNVSADLITDADVNAANKDGTAATPSLRTIGSGAQQTIAGNDSRLTNARTPTAHATTHESGGSDSIPLDTLAATTDITTLNSSTSAHGLLKKLDNNAAHYQDGTGAWSTPAGTTVPLLTTNNGGASTSTTTLNCGVGPVYFSWAGAIATLNITSTGTGTTLVLATSPTITTPTFTLGSDATGDTWYRGAGGGMTRLGIGAGGAISVVSSGVPAWLAVGSNSTVLQVSSGGVLQYSTVTNAMLAGSIAYSKLTLTASIVAGDLSGSIDVSTTGSVTSSAGIYPTNGTAWGTTYLDANKKINTAGPGTATQVWTSNGAGAAPSFQPVTASTTLKDEGSGSSTFSTINFIGGGVQAGVSGVTANVTVAAPRGTYTNLVVLYATTNKVTVTADALEVWDGSNSITLAAVNVTPDITASVGANGPDSAGLDTASAWRYIWIIYNPASGTIAALISASSTAPTLPPGYTYKRLVSDWRNDGSSNLVAFRQIGNIKTSAFVSVLSAGTATTATDVDASAAASPLIRLLWVNGFETNSSGGAGILTEKDSAVDWASWTTAGTSNADVTLMIPCTSVQKFQYRINSATNALTLYVIGGIFPL